MKTVHILGWVDAVQHLLAVDMAGQGKLHQNPVHGLVSVEFFHQRQQIGLGRVGVELVLEGLKAHLHRLLGLVAHIYLARRILAHQHHRQPGDKAVFFLQDAGSAGQAFA